MIIHALALAPIPLLSLSALGVIILNAEFNLYSIGVVFLAHFLFYLLFMAFWLFLLYISFPIFSPVKSFKSDEYFHQHNCDLDFDWPYYTFDFCRIIPFPWWHIYKIYSFYLMILFTGFAIG